MKACIIVILFNKIIRWFLMKACIIVIFLKVHNVLKLALMSQNHHRKL